MINDLLKGIGDYFRAFSLMSKLNLWRYVFFTGILSLILGIFLVFSAIMLIDIFSTNIIGFYPFEWGSEHIVGIAKFISGIIIATSLIFVYKYFVFIFFVPFLSPISEKVEEYLTGQKVGYSELNIAQLATDIIRGLRISIRLVIKELTWLIVLFLLSFVPVISLVVPFMIFIVGSFYAGYGNFDLTMERYYNVRERIGFVGYNKALTLGNGIPFTLLLSIPFIGFFLAPALSVCAATISTIERIEETFE